SYLFNPRSKTNIAAYFGQSAATGRTSLLAQCSDLNQDIIILGFLTAISYNSSPFPRLELSASCPNAPTPLMTQFAPGLAHYPLLEEEIRLCQLRYGKKVMMSLGGRDKVLELRSESEARGFADLVWGLFGPVGSVDGGLRPFGAAVIDGIDLDKSDGRPAYWDVFGAQLRARFAQDKSKDYFLSAAPQCAFPDTSIPLGYLLQCNFVWPQFFNSPRCEISSDGFLDTLALWSRALSSGVSPLRDASAHSTRFLVGLPSREAAAGSDPLGPSDQVSVALLGESGRVYVLGWV
ncbi:glycoside hydrolase superfamily, partial [Podospora aff. communis PSN243]